MADIAYRPLTNSQVSDVIPRLLTTLRLWSRRIREREELADFGERDLRDIGLSRADLYNEVNKPFWRA